MNSKPIQQSIDPRLIKTDLNTQARGETSDETIREYAEAMENGTRFPPITVFLDLENEQYILADGFHRLFAHLRVKPNDPIITEQYLGDFWAAQWYSICANQSHGFRRTNKHKRNAIELAFFNPNGAGKTDGALSDELGLSPQFVQKVRKEMEADGRLTIVESRIGKDGRVYNISNIGKAPEQTYICGGCGHYESPHCIIEGVIRAPTDPVCGEFVIREEEEPDTVEDMEPEFGDPGDDDEYIPKEVRHRVGRLKPDKYVRVPLSATNTDHAAAEIRHYFDDNYLAALAQSALKLLKDSK